MRKYIIYPFRLTHRLLAPLIGHIKESHESGLLVLEMLLGSLIWIIIAILPVAWFNRQNDVNTPIKFLIELCAPLILTAIYGVCIFIKCVLPLLITGMQGFMSIAKNEWHETTQEIEQLPEDSKLLVRGSEDPGLELLRASMWRRREP